MASGGGGLTPRQRSVLAVLAEIGAARQTQIAAELWPGQARKRRGLVQIALVQLRARGLAVRIPDGRHRLTDIGARVAGVVVPADSE